MKDYASNLLFLVFVVCLVLGMALIWLPLAVLAVSVVALVLSVALARLNRASGG